MVCNPPGSSVPGDSPGKNTRVGCHTLLKGLFSTQGLNAGLPRCRQILYHLSHQGSPYEAYTHVFFWWLADFDGRAAVPLSSYRWHHEFEQRVAGQGCHPPGTVLSAGGRNSDARIPSGSQQPLYRKRGHHPGNGWKFAGHVGPEERSAHEINRKRGMLC